MEFEEEEQEVEMAVAEAAAGSSDAWVWPGSRCASHPRCSGSPAMPCRLAGVFSNGVNCFSSVWLRRLTGGSDDVKPASDVLAGGDLRSWDFDSANAFNGAGI
jgi:hypothetical protein